MPASRTSWPLRETLTNPAGAPRGPKAGLGRIRLGGQGDARRGAGTAVWGEGKRVRRVREGRERRKQEKVRSEQARESGRWTRRGKTRERWAATCGATGEKRSPRKLNSSALGQKGGQRPGSVRGRRGWGPGGSVRARAPEGRAVTHRAAAAAAALRAAPAIQQRRRAPPRVCPARLGLPAPSPEPPPARGHVTRDLSGTRRAARRGVGGERRSQRASASRPWGTREASALPPGRPRGGAEGRAEVGAPEARRSAPLGRAGAAVPQGPRAAGWLGLRVWPPLPLSGRSSARGRTGARSDAGRVRVASWLERSSSESTRRAPP